MGPERDHRLGAYALPLAASLTLLLHAYRGHLGSDEAVVRTLPAIAAAGACIYDAVTTGTSCAATTELAAIGLALLVLARRWQVRPYLPVGLACVGAAVLTTITDWNARGWTASAVAIGAATLLVPAVLLRRRLVQRARRRALGTWAASRSSRALSEAIDPAGAGMRASGPGTAGAPPDGTALARASIAVHSPPLGA